MSEITETTSVVYLDADIINGKVQINIHEDGKLPAFLIEYSDDSKYVAVFTRIAYADLRTQLFQFVIEEYMWNTKFSRWDAIQSGMFDHGVINLGMNVKVDAVTGKYEIELTEEELENAVLIPEYLAMRSTLLVPILYPKIMSAIQKRKELNITF